MTAFVIDVRHGYAFYPLRPIGFMLHDRHVHG